MNKLIKSFAILFIAAMAFSNLAAAYSLPVIGDPIFDRNINLRAGTIVTFESTTHLEASRATVGTVVMFRVLTNVVQNQRTVIKSGTQAIGRVKGIRPSTYNDPATLEIEVKYVQAVDGQQVNLSTNPIEVTAPLPNEGVSMEVGTVVTSHTMNNIVIRVQ